MKRKYFSIKRNAMLFANHLGTLMFASFVSLAIIVISCGDDQPQYTFKEKLTAYIQKDMPEVYVESDRYAAYFDFTGAMCACADSVTELTFNGLCQKITSNSDQFDIFKLGDSQISPFPDELSPAQIFSDIKSADGSKVFYAPIEKTLKKIVKEGRPAILVTDFEEYTTDGQIYRQAYATPYFKQWLSLGGDITFYVTDYTENLIQKHLYYVIFDYNEHKLLNMVKEGLQEAPTNYTEFTLSASSYPLATNYLSAAKGGTYHDENGQDIVSSSCENGSDDDFFSVENLRAESYCFGNSWQDIVENASFQTKEQGATVPFTHLFRNLFVDISHNDSYKINSMDVKAYYIQDDFDKFWNYNVAMHNKPKIEKEAGQIYLNWDNAEAGEEFYDGNGNLLREFDYSIAPGQIVEIQDLFVFDDDLFVSTKKANPSEVEIGVYFKQGATGQILQLEDQAGLYRIDIVIKDAEKCSKELVDKLFYWEGNDCLSSSIKNTLQDMNPVGKPIFSYFVRIL